MELIDHECFDALKQAIAQTVDKKNEQNKLIKQMEHTLERQYYEFIDLIKSVMKQNEFVMQSNTILAGEEELMEGGFQFHYGDFCRRCQNGIGILECDRCHDSICFSCRKYCWLCLHVPPKRKRIRPERQIQEY